MSNIWTVYRRELSAYFNTSIAYVVIPLLIGLLSFFFFKGSPFFASERAEMRSFFEFMPLALMIFVPAVTMRVWSEELRVGTDEILMTLPLRVRDIVLGKFLAAYSVVALALLLTAGVPASIAWLGDPDWGPILGGYVGALLLAGLFVSVGCFISSLTENQVVALLLGIFAGVLMVVVLRPDFVAYLTGSDSPLTSVVQVFGVRPHFDSFERGVLALRDLVYFGSATLLFLFLNTMRVSARRLGG